MHRKIARNISRKRINNNKREAGLKVRHSLELLAVIIIIIIKSRINLMELEQLVRYDAVEQVEDY